MSSLYIHIPFCVSRCIYCGFYSTTLLELQDRYVDALCREMDLRFSITSQQSSLSTIYLGGGTPSQLSANNLQKLFDKLSHLYPLSSLLEITMEVNPDDVTEQFAKELQTLPVNRVSMGVQTFSNDRLRFLHRRHTAEQIPIAIARLRKAGIKNISIDLMFGFPGETMEEWQTDICKALELDIEHISAYSLMYEEGTPLYDMMVESRESRVEGPLPLAPCSLPLTPINEDTEREMYYELIDRLEAAGYEHYEISNFAKRKTQSQKKAKGQGRESFRSRHNSNYWNGTYYIGIGAAAHSYYAGRGSRVESGESRVEGRETLYRSWNVADLHAYIESIEKGVIPCEKEIINDDTRYNDIITTALRTREGIILPSLQPKYRHYLLDNARTALDNGLLVIENEHIHLTRAGLFVSDDVMSDLIWL